MRHQNLDWEPKRNVRFMEYIVVAEVVVAVVANKLHVTLRYFRVMHIFVVHLLGHHRTYAHTLHKSALYKYLPLMLRVLCARVLMC